MRVLVVTPTWGGRLRPEMVRALKAALATGRAEGMELEHLVLDDNPFPPPDHRNVLHMYRQARERALKQRFDVMWTVEHDVIVPQDAAIKLNQAAGDVVYGLYMVRWGDCKVINALEYVGDQNIGEPLQLYPDKLKAARQAGVARCSGVGWGCTWIRRKALRKLDLPQAWPENPSYDISFAQRAVRAGLQMQAHFGVLCGHMRENRTIRVDFNARITHNGNAWMVGGQLVPMYRSAEPGARNGTPEPGPRVLRRPVRVETGPVPEEYHTIPQPPRFAGRLAKVVTLQSVVASVNGESMRLRYGVRYELPAEVARELSRAGYVELEC